MAGSGPRAAYVGPDGDQGTDWGLCAGSRLQASSQYALDEPHYELQGLAKLLADQAPACVREQKFDSFFGRRIAVDASQHIYSFLVAYLPWSQPAMALCTQAASLPFTALSSDLRWSWEDKGTRC